MEEGTFVGWLKKDGEQVRAGEPLFTLDGDKAIQEVEAGDDGILVIPPNAPKPGSVVAVGSLLGYLRDEEETAAKAPAKAPTAEAKPARPPSTVPAATAPVPAARVAVSQAPSPARRAITPRALRKATQLGVDWSQLKGSGRGGRIRERDLAAPSGPPKQTVSSGSVAFTDWTFPDLGVEEAILAAEGHRPAASQCKTEAELMALVAGADAVVTQFARVNGNVIAAMDKARVIVRYGIGVDNVDLEAARLRGIPVCNVPDYCIDEVADQTLGFILGLTRQVVSHTNLVRGGKWGLAVPLSEMRVLREQTVGVVGFGRIGREVVRRLASFKCRILVSDPMVPAQAIQEAGAEPASLEQTLATCDILTLHCPSVPQTLRMISAETLGRMKRGSLLVNVARGNLVVTAALVEALRTGHLAGAALDVCDPEPIPADHPLLGLPNVILAPHIASASPSAVLKLRETVARLAAAALAGDLPPNVVNGIKTPRTF